MPLECAVRCTEGTLYCTDCYVPMIRVYLYLYCCTVHFEDSLIITHQRMHKLYIIYYSKIYYIKTLKMRLYI